MPRPATVAIDIGALVGQPVTGVQRVIHELVPRVAERLLPEGMSVLLVHSRAPGGLTPIRQFGPEAHPGQVKECLLAISRVAGPGWMDYLVPVKNAIRKLPWIGPALQYEGRVRRGARRLRNMLRKRSIAQPLPSIEADFYLHASFGVTPWRLPIGVPSHRVCFLLHDVIPLSHPHLVPPFVTRTFRKAVNRLNSERNFQPEQATFVTATRHAADEITHIMRSVANFIPCMEMVSWGYGRDRFYPEAAADFRTRLKLSPTKKLVLAVSTNEPRKRFAAIERSVRELARTHHVQGIFVGQSPREWTHSDETIRYLGYLNDTLLRQAYSNCDAYVNWSLCEGFGLPLIEALACGARAIIPPDSPALLEIGQPHCQIADTEHEEALQRALRQTLFDKAPRPLPPDLTRFDWDKAADVFARILQASPLKISA